MSAVHRSATTAIACRCLTSPLPLLGLAVLLVNDHLLKQAVPGVVTGKLSDLGGMAFFPFLLAALLGLVLRDARTGGPAAFWITGVVFGTVKAVPAAAAAASVAVSALGVPSLVLADATDLVALVMLYPAWLLWRRCEQAPARAPRPVLPAYVVLPLAVLATVATSCSEPPPVVSVEASNGVLSAGSFTSDDGGLTWTERASSPVYGGSSNEALPQVICHPEDPDTCYRVAGEPVLEVSRDGGATWAIGWQIPPDRRKFVRREEERKSGCGDGPQLGAVDGAWVEVDGAWSFVAAVQDEGVVVVDGDGIVRQVAVGSSEPEPLTGAFSSIGPELATTAVIALVTLWLGASLAAERLARRAPKFAEERGWAALRMGATVAAAGVLGFATFLLGFFSPTVAGEAIILAVVVAALGTTWSTRMSRKRTAVGEVRAPRRGLGWAALLWAAGAAPFVAWSAGLLSYRAGVVLAFAAMVLLARLVVRQHLDRVPAIEVDVEPAPSR